jgi:glycerol kinase
MVTALVVDIGTTSLRTALVTPDGRVAHVVQRPLTVRSPQPGEVELDANEIAALTMECALATLDAGGPADVVGIANQRQTTVLFDATTRQAIGPALGWQDLRTVFDCLILQPEGLRVAPNQMATKAKWLWENAGQPTGDIRVGSLDTWIAFVLSNGSLHVSDHSNIGLSGLITHDLAGYDEKIVQLLGLRHEMLPTIVPTAGFLGHATALPGSPALMALVGDQPASLFGQNCTSVGQTKVTFGTGSILEQRTDRPAPDTLTRFDSGCFPTPIFSSRDGIDWGVEAITLSAGTCIEWLRDDLKLITAASETDEIAQSVPTSDGVIFVPALLGLGTPQWDFGARGAFFGLTRGSSKAHLVRAVLEGIAHNAVDLIEAAETETGIAIDTVRVDGGMTRNNFLMTALADASGRVVEISAEVESTTRGAGLMALVAASELSVADVGGLWHSRATVTTQLDESVRRTSRERWHDAVHRAEKTLPDLSSVSF